MIGDRLIAIEQGDEHRSRMRIDKAVWIEWLNEALCRIVRIAEDLFEVRIGSEGRRTVRSEGANVDTLMNELEQTG